MRMTNWLRPLLAAAVLAGCLGVVVQSNGPGNAQAAVVSPTGVVEIDLDDLPAELAAEVEAYLDVGFVSLDDEGGKGKKGKGKKDKGKKDKGKKGKDKGKKDQDRGRIVTVDLDKLPPDLARQLRKFLEYEEWVQGKKGKDKAEGKKKKDKDKKGKDKKGKDKKKKKDKKGDD